MRLSLRITTALLLLSAFALCSAQRMTKVTLAASSVAGGLGTTGTVEITAKAGPNGAVVSLTSSQPTVTVPATVTVSKDQTTVTFTVSTVAALNHITAQIKATLNGSTESTSLRVEAPEVAEFTFIPNNVQGGSGSTGTVKLTSNAPTGGIKIHFSSNNPAWGGPESITVPTGATVGSLTFTTLPVGAKLDATINAYTTTTHVPAILTLTPPILTTFSLNPPNVVGGMPAVGTLKLNGVAPKEGVKIRLSAESGSLKFPETITIPAGETTATFNLTTKPVSELTPFRIVARAPASSIELAANINLPSIESLALSLATVTGGMPITGTVKLNAPAPQGGLVVNLSSKQTMLKFPATVTVPAGATTATFTIATSTVTANESAILSANVQEGKPQTATVFVITGSSAKKTPPAQPI